MHAGLVEPIKRGHYRITPAGKALLDSNPTKIDKNTLRTYPDFLEWLTYLAGRSKEAPEVPVFGASEPQDTTETPQELIDSAHAALQDALAEELLEQLLAVTPARFEQVIVDLLIAMGYGSGRAEMGRAIGKSGDGGIDGIINEDKLGLDAVYIQAKRYKPENAIGRPALQGFVGSLIGARARKGVFVTTSSFTKEAWGYVRGIEQRVVLIDGARLARLMIDHGVGVRTSATYVIRRIDEDYFSVD
ncbi:restriction endonuclease [Paracoccus sp. MC1862]|nr:restriction endonuclease [Paracoccus sp. MC1862]